MPPSQKPKYKNGSRIITNSIKTLKWSTSKKKKKSTLRLYSVKQRLKHQQLLLLHLLFSYSVVSDSLQPHGL